MNCRRSTACVSRTFLRAGSSIAISADARGYRQRPTRGRFEPLEQELPDFPVADRRRTASSCLELGLVTKARQSVYASARDSELALESDLRHALPGFNEGPERPRHRYGALKRGPRSRGDPRAR